MPPSFPNYLRIKPRLTSVVGSLLSQLHSVHALLNQGIRWLLHFIYHINDRFSTDRCFQTAAALTYTSLLSLVPLFTVAFSLLTAFPVFESWSKAIQDFIFANFVPASGEIVQDYLIRFADQASHLTAVGIIFLVITALMLMQTIDHALNDIWEVRDRREGMSVFMVYWAVLSLGPLLVGLSLAVTSYLVSLPLFSYVAHNPKVAQLQFSIMPFLLTTSAFTLIYVLVPNRTVFLRHGFIGGLIAALLFEIAKRTFVVYVTELTSYELVYGTFAAIPIFLFWVYISWLIILLGAEVTRSLVSFYWHEDKAIPCIPTNSLVCAFRLIGHLWQAQQQGETLALRDLQHIEPHFSDSTLDKVINHLERKQWLHRTLRGHYALSRNMHDATLLDLYQSLSGLLLTPVNNIHDVWDQALNVLLCDTHTALRTILQVPLSQLYLSNRFSKE